MKPQEPKRPEAIDLEKQVRLFPTLSSLRLNLDPSSNPALRGLCRQGSVDEAYSIYERACTVDPLLDIPAMFWNSLCWYACLGGVDGAKRYSFAGELAIALEPENDGFRDTRGLSRALLGNREGAISDFEAFISFAQNYRRRKERREWIRLLRLGLPIDQIFTPEVRERLKGE